MAETINEYSQKKDPFYKKFLSLWAIIYVLLLLSTWQSILHISLRQKWVIWFGEKIVHLSYFEKITMTGSGDTTYDYVLTLFIFILSLIIAAIVAIADNKRKNYQQFYLFTIVLARYYVAYIMFTYGFAKVFVGQFPALSYYSLEKTFGDMSPMGVLWRFMETSRAYTFFGGLMEVTGGLLLLFRKTKTFGALFSMTVMVNVAMLNYSYDVPVKIFSTHIVLLCVFILTYEWKKLYNFFILHKAEILNYNKLRVRKEWMLISLKAVKGLLIAFLLYTFLLKPMMYRSYEKAPLEGVYSTKLFVMNNDTLPFYPLNNVRWNKLYIVGDEGINVVIKENKNYQYYSKIDTVQKTIAIRINKNELNPFARFDYILKKDTLFLNGNIDSDSVKVIFIRKTKEDYPLLNRGFHWVNEYPYNR